MNLNNLTGRSLLSRSWPSRSGLYSFSLLGFVCLNRSFWFYRSFSWQLCFLHFSEVSIFSRLKKYYLIADFKSHANFVERTTCLIVSATGSTSATSSLTAHLLNTVFRRTQRVILPLTTGHPCRTSRLDRAIDSINTIILHLGWLNNTP